MFPDVSGYRPGAVPIVGGKPAFFFWRGRAVSRLSALLGGTSVPVRMCAGRPAVPLQLCDWRPRGGVRSGNADGSVQSHYATSKGPAARRPHDAAPRTPHWPAPARPFFRFARTPVPA